MEYVSGKYWQNKFYWIDTVMTTIDNDESSESTNIRQTHTQPTISWLPLTNEQVYIILLNNLCLSLLFEIGSWKRTSNNRIKISWRSTISKRNLFQLKTNSFLCFRIQYLQILTQLKSNGYHHLIHLTIKQHQHLLMI